MSVNDKNILDIGYDFNKDKHCDLDGWFVNNNGNHKPVIRERTNFIDAKLKDPSYTPNELNNHFCAYGNYYGYKLSALNEYSLNDDEIELSSPNINNALRNSNINSLKLAERISHLDELISHFTIKDELVVYRGIPLSTNIPIEMLKLKENDIYYDKAFMSTSYSMPHAVNYGLGGNIGMIFIQIKLKKNTNAVPIFESIAGKKDENEILINRGQKFVVKKRLCSKVKNNKYLIFYEMETI